MSQWIATAFRPRAITRSTVRSRSASLMSAAAISAPNWASPIAIACPRPEAAPVTTATRPVRSNRLGGIALK
ncbi:MAG: hypothetical protein WBD62_18190 [Anaerolineales bacterium]